VIAGASGNGAEINSELMYEGMVRARMRRQPGSPVFAPLKNAFCLTVSRASIEIRPTGPFQRLGGLLGLSYTFPADQVTVGSTRLGLLGSSLFARQWLVFGASQGKHVTEIAVTPCDGDLTRLQKALVEAGVTV
jgi:hypothetical protein